MRSISVWWLLIGAVLLAVLAFPLPQGIFVSTGHPGPGSVVRCEANVHEIQLELLGPYPYDRVLPDVLPRDDRGRPFSCPVAQNRCIPADKDGYEYIGMGLHHNSSNSAARTPIVFDRQDNHPDHTRSVAFLDGHLVLMHEDEFRKVLVQAIGSGAYSPATVQMLRQDEPWLGKELGGH